MGGPGNEGRVNTFRWITLVLILVVATPLAVWAHNLRPFGPETVVSDLWFRTRPARAPRRDLLIVARDPKTLKELGKPSHADYARLVRRLTDAGAAWIVLDLDLDERQGRAADGALWRAIEASRRTLVLVRHRADATRNPDDDELRGLRALERSVKWQEVGLTGRTPEWNWLDFTPATSDFIHSAHAAGVAVDEQSRDGDGVLRRSRAAYFTRVLYPADEEQGKLTNFYAVIPNLAVSTAVAAMGGDEQSLDYRFGQRLAFGTATRVPLDAQGFVPIDYVGPAGTLPRVSMSDVIEGEVDSARIKDRIVFVGSTVPGDELSDYQRTPTGTTMPRVEITAQMTQGFLDQRSLVLPHVVGAWAIFGLALLLGAVAPLFRPGPSALAAVLILAGYLLLGWVLFWARSIMLPVLPALVLTLSSIAIMLAAAAVMRPYSEAELVEVRDTGMAIGAGEELPDTRRRWGPFRRRGTGQ
ncbi:MAG: CHASE2 domain-containing protein [Armatimonadota bacterium]